MSRNGVNRPDSAGRSYKLRSALFISASKFTEAVALVKPK